MSSIKGVTWLPVPPSRDASAGVRSVIALVLVRVSTTLAQLAGRIGHPPRAAVRADPRLEFHADAGAPDGALYADGELVGWLRGVRRL